MNCMALVARPSMKMMAKKRSKDLLYPRLVCKYQLDKIRSSVQTVDCELRETVPLSSDEFKECVSSGNYCVPSVR